MSFPLINQYINVIQMMPQQHSICMCILLKSVTKTSPPPQFPPFQFVTQNVSFSIILKVILTVNLYCDWLYETWSETTGPRLQCEGILSTSKPEFTAISQNLPR